jgi:hypothetical protein
MQAILGGMVITSMVASAQLPAPSSMDLRCAQRLLSEQTGQRDKA